MGPFDGKRVILWVTSRALDGDGARDLSAVQNQLARLGCRVETVVSDQPAPTSVQVKNWRPDLILAHVCNQCRAPLEMLSRPERTAALPPVVLLATALDMPAYLEGMRRGAFDCVGLPLQEKEFVRILARALEGKVREQVP
jgi:DNA-binding NtrC family response regulator